MLVGALCRVCKGYMCPYCWDLYSESVVSVQVDWNWNKISWAHIFVWKRSITIKLYSEIQIEYGVHVTCDKSKIFFKPREMVEYWCACKNSQCHPLRWKHKDGDGLSVPCLFTDLFLFWFLSSRGADEQSERGWSRMMSMERPRIKNTCWIIKLAVSLAVGSLQR